jgi:hypothetical protein
MSPATKRRLASAVITGALMYGAAMLSLKGFNLKGLMLLMFSPGLKVALLFFPEGLHGSNPKGYLKLSIFLSFIILFAIVDLLWIAIIKLRTGKSKTR